MDPLRRAITSRESGAALIIILAFVVLLTGVAVAYLSRTTSDRQVAHGSFNQSKGDQLVASAMDNIVGDLRQEIVNGSTRTDFGGSPPNEYYVYTPTSTANMIPQRSGNAAGVPNLIRRSVRLDSLSGNPGLPSRASAVNSTTDVSVNGRYVTPARWNTHYLVPKKNTGPGLDDSIPIDAFANATPDWVYVTSDPANSDAGRRVIAAPDPLVIGRYAYAVYDEGGLLDMNVAGYPTGTTANQSGRKGSLAFADLRYLCPTGDCTAQNYGLPNPNASGVYQIDRLVGWRNYATTQPSNNFPDSAPPGQAFARNFQTSSVPATNFYNYVINNTTGFLSTSTSAWAVNTNALRTDQSFVQRQELLAFRKTTQFSSNALQYISTFSRETNSPSFSPAIPTTVNPNFLLARVITSFTRFDGTPAVVGEPLVKTRFPLSRLAWITYKGPSASLNVTDPIYTALVNAGVSTTTIQAGTAANIKACFGLTFGGTVGDPSYPWIYTNPTGSGPANRILRLDEVANAGREPDSFELLQAGILNGSLGQNTGGGVTGGNVFPDVHMSNTAHHILSIGAAIIDQTDPDSIPTRIQFTGTNGNTWTTYGVESLPYITQIYPISGYSTATTWATYLLFQLWNPHIGPALSPAAPQVRLRVDGGIGIFTGGNGRTWSGAADQQQVLIPSGGQSIPLTLGAFAPSGTPAPLGTANATAVGAFERLPGSLNGYIGLRLLPDHTLLALTNPQLTLFFGTDATHQFNATMECNPPGTSIWIPYNHFIGINDPSSWISGDTVPVRNAGPTGKPDSVTDAFTTSRLTDPGPPACLMKADPRATRFGIFQVDVNLDTTAARILQPLWPTNLPTTIPNGYGGDIADPGGPVEHAPLRFAGNPYFPATLCINAGASTSTRTGYADNDGIIRPADAIYPDPSVTTTGSSTPYYTTSLDYHPIILNRPFRNVAELGYAFRDLPWKTLDFFTDKSADAGLLDIFTINDGAQVITGGVAPVINMVMPTMTAGKINLNATQPADLQSVLAGAILNELDSTDTVNTGTSATAAPVLADHILNAPSGTLATPMQNRSELVTRSGFSTDVLPVPGSGAAHDQRVKSRREVVPRAISSVSQMRNWNLLIDVIAQSGRYPSNVTANPNPADLPKFLVEGEQHYWVHVAIDRFTGQVIDKQIEVVNE